MLPVILLLTISTAIMATHKRNKDGMYATVYVKNYILMGLLLVQVLLNELTCWLRLFGIVHLNVGENLPQTKSLSLGNLCWAVPSDSN